MRCSNCDLYYHVNIYLESKCIHCCTCNLLYYTDYNIHCCKCNYNCHIGNINCYRCY